MIKAYKGRILDYLIAVFQDVMRSRAVSEKVKLAEQAASESRRLLESSLNALSARIAVLNECGTIVGANEAWKRFTSANGYTGGGCGEGANYLKVCEEAGRSNQTAAAIAKAITEVIEFERDFFYYEYPSHDQDENGWFAVKVTRFEEANPIRVVVAHENVTERKRIEQALRQSEANYRGLVEHAVHGIYRSDPSGKFLAVNPALVEMLGYDSADEVLDLQLARDVYVDPEEGARLAERCHETDLIAAVEMAWMRKDGSFITVRLTGRAIRDADGGVECFEIIAEDVTERQKLEAQLRLAQKMEALGRLAGGVAHDFNNLLTVIMAESEMGLADLTEDGPVRDGLQAIGEAGERASQLTRQLLAFSRRQLIEPAYFSLNDLVTDLEKMLRRLIGEDVELLAHTAPDLGTVHADRGQIEQVLMNLVVNARDAMPRGGKLAIETANVTLDEEYARTHPDVRPGEFVMLAVTDSGTAMTRETMAHLFEPFFTTKEAGEGTGLGLATSYGIVKQGGGHIAVYSELGIGTAMKVYLPRVAAPVEHNAKPETTMLPRGTETVLLVEDEKPVRDVALPILKQRG